MRLRGKVMHTQGSDVALSHFGLRTCHGFPPRYLHLDNRRSRWLEIPPFLVGLDRRLWENAQGSSTSNSLVLSSLEPLQLLQPQRSLRYMLSLSTDHLQTLLLQLGKPRLGIRIMHLRLPWDY